MTRGPARRRRRLVAAAIGGLLVLGASGCSSGIPSDDGAAETEAGAPGPQATPPDPAAAALATEVAALSSAITTARDALLDAAGAGQLDAARAAARTAADQLVADAPLGPDETRPTPPPVMPGPMSSRTRDESIDYGDAFTSTLSAARAAGEGGTAVLGALRDSLAGDVGAWQRDPAGMLESIEAVIATAGSPAETEDAVADLPGEISKAIVFARLAARADVPSDVQAFADRGAAHLDIIDTALSALDLPGD